MGMLFMYNTICFVLFRFCSLYTFSCICCCCLVFLIVLFGISYYYSYLFLFVLSVFVSCLFLCLLMYILRPCMCHLRAATG